MMILLTSTGQQYCYNEEKVTVVLTVAKTTIRYTRFVVDQCKVHMQEMVRKDLLNIVVRTMSHALLSVKASTI